MTTARFLGLAAIMTTALAVSEVGGAEVPTTGRAVPSMAAYDAYFTKLVQECGDLGVQVAVSRNGRLVFDRGYGWSDKSAGEAVEPSSLFRIASVTKPLTSTAIFQLVDKGALKLDDRVVDLLDLHPTGDER